MQRVAGARANQHASDRTKLFPAVPSCFQLFPAVPSKSGKRDFYGNRRDSGQVSQFEVSWLHGQRACCQLLAC